MGFEFASLNIPPKPALPGFPFEAPSKLRLMKSCGGGTK